MPKPKILVVDDEIIIAMDIRHMLESFDYEVAAVCSSGREALRLTEVHQPDLILMDIILPGEIDGIEAASQIRNRYDIPVIYMTANADARTVETARRTEPYAYLNKPIQERDLYSNIDSALYRHQMDKKLRASEENYRNLIEQINEAVFATDLEGKVTFSSAAIQAMTGFQQSEVMGRHFKDFIHPEDLAKIEESVKQRLAGKKGWAECRIRTKSGGYIWIHASSNPLFADGRCVGLNGVMMDITERKMAEEELRLREARVASILRAAPIGIGVVVNRILKEVNDRFCLMTGYSRDELIGRSACVLYPDQEEFERVGREKYRQIRARGTGSIETRFVKKDGSIIHVLLSSSPINPGDLSEGVTFTAMEIKEPDEKPGNPRA
ncbi:PAS domain S-box protein [bacterium]|nr:PAS domain S-box protein [bacterium]